MICQSVLSHASLPSSKDKNMSRKSLIVSCLFTFLTSVVFAQVTSLRAGIERVLASKNARVGVAITGLDGFDSLSINGSQHFPLQSVFKFPIALAVLNEVDNGRLFLGLGEAFSHFLPSYP